MKLSKTTLLALLSSPALLFACGSAKSTPTWLEDVRPLVQANCVRCHAPPSIGGAPTDFRLDVYEDTVADNGQVIRGAKTMARFMAIRAGDQGDMPPDQPLADLHRDTFANWGQSGATLGARSNNLSPRAVLRSELREVDSEVFSVEIDVSDAQNDLVWGELRVGDLVVNRSLRNGRNLVSFFTGTLPEGDHELVAHLSDDETPSRRNLGSLRVRHADGVAPTLALAPLLRDALIAEDSLALQIAISDPDPAQTHSIDVVAFRGQEEIPVAVDTPATGASTEIVWDTAAMPEGPGWRLRVSAVDSAGLATTIESGRFVISHQSTTLGISDVSALFDEACAACHPRSGLAGLDFFISADDLQADVDARRGLIYRRVIQEATMPPASAESFAEALQDSWRPLTDADKDKLAEYLLGGSPP